MLNYPNPTEDILLPYMHPNLAQLTRVWIATTLLTGKPLFPMKPRYIAPHHMISPLTARSQASSIIIWENNPFSSVDPAIHTSETANLTCVREVENLQSSQPIQSHKNNILPPSRMRLTISSLPSPKPPLTPKSSNLHTAKKSATGRRSFRVESPLRTFLTQVEFSQTSIPGSSQHSFIPPTSKKLPNIQVDKQDTPTTNRTRPPRQLCSSTKPLLEYDGFSKVPTYSHLDEPWGHLSEEIDTSKVFRVLLQNPNSLKLSEGDEMARYSFSEAFHLGVGAICLPETNTNWNLRSSLSQISWIIKPIWQCSCTQTSHLDDNFESTYPPGGTLTTICNNWTSRILEKGADPYGLGRWSCFILQGKGTVKIVLITAYQVCSTTISTLGPTTQTCSSIDS